jgi:hypothetical protein
VQADETLSRIKRLLPIRVKNFDRRCPQVEGKRRSGLMMIAMVRKWARRESAEQRFISSFHFDTAVTEDASRAAPFRRREVRA